MQNSRNSRTSTGMFSFFSIFLLLVLYLVSCRLPFIEYEIDQYLSFPDFADFTSITGGEKGELLFDEVLVGAENILPLKIMNKGDNNLIIENIAILGKHFAFVDRLPPEFPLTIKPNTTHTYYLAFYPQTNGRHEGRAVIKAGDAPRHITLKGAGVWKVTLSVNKNIGEITTPISVIHADADTKSITTIDGALNLSAEAYFLRKFSRWNIVGSPKIAPEFTDELAADTQVTVKDHTHIEAFFLDPWIYFHSDSAYAAASARDTRHNLQDAINAVAEDQAANGESELEGVIIKNGVHDIDYDVKIKTGVSIFGGYHTSLTEEDGRRYKSRADREDEHYRSVLNFLGNNYLRIADGRGITLEGVTLQRGEASGQPLLNISGPRTALIQYNTITAQGAGAALMINNASPIIRNNYLRGGDHADESTGVKIMRGAPLLQENTILAGSTTNRYSQSRGVWLDNNSEAVIFKNTISSGTAGTAAAKDCRSYGIFIDWECFPLIEGNTISGGQAPGEGGETTGVYYINNGRATLRYNTIDGGSGSGIARALYSAYGTNFYLRYNNLTTSGGGSRYGIYLGANGRVRRLLHNGLTNVNTALHYEWVTGTAITTITALNDKYRTDTNRTSIIDFDDDEIDFPTEPGQQEWD